LTGHGQFTSRRETFASVLPALIRTHRVHVAGTLLCRGRQERTQLTFRIHRSSAPDGIVFALSGDMDREHAVRLQDFLASVRDRDVTLDLQHITLVDRATVEFLAAVEPNGGVRIINCPGYVRTWIAAERDGQSKQTREPDKQEPQL